VLFSGGGTATLFSWTELVWSDVVSFIFSDL